MDKMGVKLLQLVEQVAKALGLLLIYLHIRHMLQVVILEVQAALDSLIMEAEAEVLLLPVMEEKVATELEAVVIDLVQTAA